MTERKAGRVLVVDDENALCEVLKARLETFGYLASVAFNGRQAWDQVLADPPDLILLDIRMPEEDGYTFLKRLRSYREPANHEREQRFRKLPVIVMTGTGEGMKPLFEQENIAAYITKPIDSSLLRKLIADSLKASS